MSFYDTLCEIEDLADNKSPTDVELQHVLELFKTPAAEDYFFTRVQSVRWIELLDQKQAFKKPPDLIYLNDSIVFPFWTKSAALARIARTEPSAIAKVARRITRTPNPRVNDDLMKIAASVRTIGDVRNVLPHALNYAKQPYHLSASVFGDVIEHWVSIRTVDPALRITKEILQFKRGSPVKARKTSKRSRALLRSMSREPEPRIRDWEFKQILDNAVRKLGEAEPQRTLQLLIGSIGTYLRLSARGSDDYSEIWCPDVGSQRGHHEAIGAVVRAAVNCFASVSGDTQKFRSADALLRMQDGEIFNRIRWYVYGRSPEVARSAIAKDLLSYVPKFSTRLYPAEFADMISRSAHVLGKQLLSPSKWQRLWRSLANEPVLTKEVDWLGRRLTKAEVRVRQARLRQARMTPFKSLLPVKLSRELRRLEKRFGAVNYRRFAMGESKTIESRSPLSEQALAAMTNPELIDFVNTWAPPKERSSSEWWIETNITGLSAQFISLVIHDPERFRNWPNWWRELKRPIFLRRFIEAAAEAIKTKPLFEWPLLIEIAKWITEQPVRSDSLAQASEESSEDPDWSFARNAVVRFLSAALSDESSIPVSYNDSVLGLLKNLSSGSDPAADRDSDGNGDPLTRGINTTRGAAIETCVRYAYWLRRNLANGREVNLTEFWAIIEGRLRGVQEVPAVYAVIGTLVPFLCDLSDQWVRDHCNELFPRSPAPIWKAAWNSFVCYTRPHPKPFRAIRSVYEYAVSHMEANVQIKHSRRDAREALGMHLLNLYWFGELQLDDPLLTQFYEHASAYILGELTREIGRLFSQEPEIRPEVLQRLMALCDKRLEIASSRPLPGPIKRMMDEEIAWFASWLEIAALPADWRLERLGRVLRLVQRIDAHNVRVDRLVREIPTYLAAVVRCFKLLSEKLPRDAYLSSERDAAKAILRAGLQSTDRDIHDDAVQARDNLLLAGRFEFMQLGD